MRRRAHRWWCARSRSPAATPFRLAVIASAMRRKAKLQPTFSAGPSGATDFGGISMHFTRTDVPFLAAKIGACPQARHDTGRMVRRLLSVLFGVLLVVA